MRNRVSVFAAGIALLISVVPLLAHHPVENDFDKTKYARRTCGSRKTEAAAHMQTLSH